MVMEPAAKQCPTCSEWGSHGRQWILSYFVRIITTGTRLARARWDLQSHCLLDIPLARTSAILLVGACTMEKLCLGFRNIHTWASKQSPSSLKDLLTITIVLVVQDVSARGTCNG
mmetsp:Transcript_13100/g.28179  ORF Transcript_13100/g.28179 Transcript_13100/m.28179 type:complete len:115 (-) Transcript_13100:142-486(-)